MFDLPEILTINIMRYKIEEGRFVVKDHEPI